jgi:hypothetical protein
MGFEKNVKESFRKAREDAEGIKNELAFALKRIAKIEELLTKQAIRGLANIDTIETRKVTKYKRSSKKKR